MSPQTKKINWSQVVPLAILVVSVGALATAYIAQYGFGMQPCILCLYQRVPYAVTGLLAVLALGMPAGGHARAIMTVLCAVVFLVGSGIAFYHFGVEQHWWASAASCGGTPMGKITLEQLRQQLQVRQPKACDQVDWTLFGISMAGYNVVVSLALSVASFAGSVAIRRRSMTGASGKDELE